MKIRIFFFILSCLLLLFACSKDDVVYQLKIKDLTPTSMSASVNVVVNGNPFNVNLIFNKISENVNLKS